MTQKSLGMAFFLLTILFTQTLAGDEHLTGKFKTQLYGFVKVEAVA